MGIDGVLSDPIDLDGPRRRPAFRPVPGEMGLVVEHRESGFIGSIVSWGSGRVTLRDPSGRDRSFALTAGAFSLDGERVALTAPARAARPAAGGSAAGGTSLTASGSVDLGSIPAKVARASRIYVEGTHDADLLEKVWGEDLRVEGVVVEPMDGADGLAGLVRAFGPRPGRRLGVLLDHLVDGSKEQRLASSIDHPDVLITGHPFVDIWQAVRPATVGISAWPEIPMGTSWKEGIVQAFGWPGTTGELWVKLLRSVTSYRDLEPALVGAVERLIDFVAPPRD